MDSVIQFLSWCMENALSTTTVESRSLVSRWRVWMLTPHSLNMRCRGHWGPPHQVRSRGKTKRNGAGMRKSTQGVHDRRQTRQWEPIRVTWPVPIQHPTAKTQMHQESKSLCPMPSGLNSPCRPTTLRHSGEEMVEGEQKEGTFTCKTLGLTCWGSYILNCFKELVKDFFFVLILVWKLLGVFKSQG